MIGWMSMERNMTDHTTAKGILPIGCLALVVITLASASGYVWYQLEKGWTPSKVELALKDAPPPSSCRTQIEGWLTNIGWTGLGSPGTELEFAL